MARVSFLSSKFFILILSLLVLPFVVFPQSVLAATIPYTITTGIPGQSTTPGATFLTVNLNIDYQSGQIIFSGNPDGTGNTAVDDAAMVWVVRRPDGTSASVTFRYDNGCSFISSKPPQDVTYLFKPGINQVQVKLYDICGISVGSSPLYLVNINAPDLAPTPFLDLPWDYQGKGLSFNEAALLINSFFDHEYPLLSSGLEEPNEVKFKTLPYNNDRTIDVPYSSHDGYDYGKPAKVNLGDPVLAAASGWATYSNSCGACGNAIHIDHGNGYQTRYYHLLKDGLIVNTPGEKVWVNAGEPIGKVGSTGNSTGAHIHFMVVQDKNHDGNFDDNIPDGVTDPFGWQSEQPDPWPLFSFTYGGKQRTGNTSYYLWKKPLDNLNASLPSNGGVFQVGRTALKFPPGSTDQTLQISLKAAPATVSQNLSSIGSIVLATAKDSLGNLIHHFLVPYTINIDFSMFDLTRFKPETISIYSSEDGINWTKENTVIEGTIAQASVDHMSYFALMGERKDVIPPTTSAILEGQSGQPNWFRSDVKLTLKAQDNEGGLGIDYTLYSLDGGDWEIYTAPLTFTNEGHYKVEFYSADNDANIEEVKSVEFDIDKTIPEAKIFIDPQIPDLVVDGIDKNQVSVTKRFNDQTKKKDDAVYEITDQAGNTLKLDVRDRDREKNDQFSLYSIQYNGAAPIYLDANSFKVKYQKKKDKLNLEEQQFTTKGEVKVKIKYDIKDNQSIILAQEAGKEKVKEIVAGLRLLQLTTKEGILNFSY